ncbi:MAG: type IV pilus assembly protein PilM [Phycisphaerae bacterium]|nr:type IV pilus assembly protein PilM [Phycisphaerae bacterium]
MSASNVCWGIEVGAGAIKALKVERDGEDLRIADFAVVPHKKVLSTPDLNRDDAIAVALGSFMSQYRDALRGATIAVSVPGHSAFARFAKLPPVEKKGIANLVRFEAVQQIPFPIDDVEWDYQTFASDDSPDIEVGIFAVTKAKIAEMLALYGEQGLVPNIITLSPVAVYNAVAYDIAFTAKTPGTVILDIGTTATDLIIAEGGRVWIRTFPLGGHNFTEALAATFKLTYGKAEKLKKEAETSKYKRHIFQALKPVLQELVQDVQRSIGYYRDTHPDASITRVVGVGSTFKLIGLRKLLSQQLKMDVFRYERAKRLSIDGAAAADFEASAPNMATAYGLALQGLGLQTIDANLMPTAVVRQAMWKRKMPWFVAAAGLGIAGGALSFARPLLDSMAINRAKTDSQLTNPIRQVIAQGNALKAKWAEASSGKHPGYVAENMRRFFEGRDLYPMFLEDLGSMFKAAEAYGRGHGLPPAVMVAELRKFETEYLPPGQSFGAKAPTRDPFSGGDRDAGGAPGAPGADATTAGQAGAVKFTLVFDSPQDSRAFVNDSFLAWLRTNSQRAGVPYVIVGLPSAADISTQPIAPPKPKETPRTPSPGAPTSPPRGPSQPNPPAGGDRDAPPADDGPQSIGGPSKPPTPPPSTPRSPSAPGGSSTGQKADVDLDRIAPLPEGILAPPRTDTTYRYTVTWFAQIRPVSEMEKESSAGSTGQEAPQ